MAKRPIWSGALTFGLVNVPVRLYSAVAQKGISFNLLHDKDGGRIRNKRVCSVDEEEVPYEHIVKGYPIAKDQYVVVSPDELKLLEAKVSKVIAIEDFVDLEQIDPVYFETTYHLVPEPQSVRAFALLSEAMRRARRVGIARIVLRTRTSLCAVRPMGDGLALSTMNAADELVPLAEVREHLPEPGPLDPRELKMAGQLIDSLGADFQPERYRDEYREKLMELIEAKAQGKKVAAPSEAPPVAVAVNLMEALERSLAAAPRKGERRVRAQAARVGRPVAPRRKGSA